MAVTITDSEGPLQAQQLEAVEQHLGIHFPADYRSFMLRYNGGRTKPDGFAIAWLDGQAAGEDWKTSTLSWLFFVSNDPEENLLRMNGRTFLGRIPPGTVAVGRDAGGNLILLALAGPYQGKVLFWCRDYEDQDAKVPGYDNVGVIADNFDDFLANKLY